MTRLLLALLLTLPALARGVTLTDTSGFAFCPFPPGLEIDPGDDDVALAACSAVPGVFPISITPGSPMAFVGPNYFLPGSLDCSASGGATPAIASLALDSADRAWLATSNCELAVPFALATGAGWVKDFAPRMAPSSRNTRCFAASACRRARSAPDSWA